MRCIVRLVMSLFLSCLIAGQAFCQDFTPGSGRLTGLLSALSSHAGSVEVDFGYIGARRGAFISLEAEGAGLGQDNAIGHALDLDGVQLGLSAAFTVAGRVGVVARASRLFPFGQVASEDALAMTGVGAAGGSRDWSRSVQWWTLDVAAAGPVYAAASIIGGLRLDSFDASMRAVSGYNSGAGSPSDRRDITATAYLPYVGFMTTHGHLSVGVIGSPWVLGHVDYRQTIAAQLAGGWGNLRPEGRGPFKDGYFMEGFAEVTGNPLGRYGEIGVFAKYTLVHGLAAFDVASGQAPPAGQASDRYNFTFQRQNWMLGGKLALNFSSPM
jgi:hypothetical protein